jgi:hypothetical protein
MSAVDIGVRARFQQQLHHIAAERSFDPPPVNLLRRRPRYCEQKGGTGYRSLRYGSSNSVCAELANDGSSANISRIRDRSSAYTAPTHCLF